MQKATETSPQLASKLFSRDHLVYYAAVHWSNSSRTEVNTWAFDDRDTVPFPLTKQAMRKSLDAEQQQQRDRGRSSSRDSYQEYFKNNGQHASDRVMDDAVGGTFVMSMMGGLIYALQFAASRAH